MLPIDIYKLANACGVLHKALEVVLQLVLKVCLHLLLFVLGRPF